jgi:hypothetical protein
MRPNISNSLGYRTVRVLEVFRSSRSFSMSSVAMLAMPFRPLPGLVYSPRLRTTGTVHGESNLGGQS